VAIYQFTAHLGVIADQHQRDDSHPVADHRQHRGQRDHHHLPPAMRNMEIGVQVADHGAGDQKVEPAATTRDEEATGRHRDVRAVDESGNAEPLQQLRGHRHRQLAQGIT
jgi:hypothetical protein